MSRIWIVIALLCGFAGHARAQTCTVATTGSCSVSGGTLSLTIGRAVQLSLSSASTTLPAPGLTHFNQGYTESGGPTVTVQANVPFSVTLAAGSSTWAATPTTSQPARSNKPSTDLLWSAGGALTALSPTPVQVYSGPATAGSSRTLNFRTLYAWNLDTPGSYSIQLVFTVTAP